MKVLLTRTTPSPTPNRTEDYLLTNQLFNRQGDFVGGDVKIFVGTELVARPHPQGYSWELLVTRGQPRLSTGVRVHMTDEQLKFFTTPIIET